MKFILTFFILIALAFGGMIALAHHDTTERAALAYKQYVPVTASFSRLRGDRHHVRRRTDSPGRACRLFVRLEAGQS